MVSKSNEGFPSESKTMNIKMKGNIKNRSIGQC